MSFGRALLSRSPRTTWWHWLTANCKLTNFLACATRNSRLEVFAGVCTIATPWLGCEIARRFGECIQEGRNCISTPVDRSWKFSYAINGESADRERGLCHRATAAKP